MSQAKGGSNEQPDETANGEPKVPDNAPSRRGPEPGDKLKTGPGDVPQADAAIVADVETPALTRRTERATQGPSRGVVRTVHYDLSYILRNADRGTRGAIVLLHDLPGGAFTWADALPALDATGRAVYAFDMLGYGESDHPWPSDTSIWGHADTLSYALAELGLSEIVLVGFGQGGAVAQVLATRLYRAQTAALVLIDTYAYEYAFAPDWPLPEMAKRQDPDAPKHTPLDQVLADLRNTLPSAAAKTKFLAGSKLDAYVSEWNSEVGKELLFQHVRLMLPLYSNSVSPYVRQLTIPVLVVWGEVDQITPVRIGERLAREIADAQLKVVPGAGHLLLDDAPEAVGTAIADFVGALAKGRAAAAR
jgi:pimeloyl-ACP methyl ester carboxylesterase